MSDANSPFDPPGDDGAPPLVLQLVASLARHGLTAAGTLLVSDGLLTRSQSEQLITLGLGAASLLATAAWSYIQKRNVKKAAP
jgi:hypothetical protein